MTREEFWEQTHQKMIDKLNEVLPIINEDSPNFIELDWCDATGEFSEEWIRTMIVNIHNEQRIDEVIQLIASDYHKKYMNGERAAYANNMPDFGVPKHQDIKGMMETYKQIVLARIKANKDDEELKKKMRSKYNTAAGGQQDDSAVINKQLEEENARLKAENKKLLERMSHLQEGKGFTCGQYAALLYAVAQKLEDCPVKTHLEKVFAKITGYSANMFHNKLAGEIADKDKNAVYDIIKDEMPKLADAVSKL
jgi:hypothetical protein